MSSEWSARSYVLLVPWELSHPGGVNQVVMNLHDELEAMHPGLPLVMVKSWAHRRPWDGMVEGRRTRRWRFRDPFPVRNRLRSWVLFWAALPLQIGRLLLWFVSQRVQVVNAHYPGTWLLPFAILRRLCRCPRGVVVSLHGLDLQDAKAARGLRRGIWRYVLGSADRISACSDALAEETREAFPSLADRVVAVPNGVNPEALRASARTPDAVTKRLAKGRHYIASVATFEAKKGQDVLLEAFAVLADARPELDVVLAGRDGATLESLREKASQLGLSERVLFLPDLTHDHASGVIRSASVFALPSRYEPFGIVVLEAGAHGVPVVASRVGGVPEILVDEEYGRLVPPDDPTALVHALVDVLDNPETARMMANALQHRVDDKYSWRRVAERYLQISDMPVAQDGVAARGEEEQ